MRLRQHRHIVLLIGAASILIIGFMSALVALEAPLLDDARNAERYHELPLRAATVIKLLAHEQRVACDFVTRPFPGGTDSERQLQLVSAQRETMSEINGLFQHYSDLFIGEDAGAFAGPSEVFPFAAVAEVQSMTLKRTLTPGQLSVHYQLAKQRAVQLLLGAASRMSAPRHSSSISAVIMANLLFAEAAERIVLVSALRHSHLTEESLAQILELENLIQFQCAMYQGITRGDTLITGLIRSLQDGSRDTVNILKGFVRFPSTWVSYIGNADVTSEEIAGALPVVLQTFLDRQENIILNTSGTTVEYAASIGLSVCIIILVLIALFISFRRLCLSTLAKEAEAEQAAHIDVLGGSYHRVLRFLGSIIRLDVAHIRSTEGKAVQTTERDVYALEHHIKKVMRLMHPAVPRWRSLLVSPDGSHSPLFRGGPVPRELVTLPTTILMIDLSAYQVRPTGESIKTYPAVVSALLQSIAAIVEGVGGVLHEVSGTRAVVGWNLTVPNADHEMSACHAVIAIQRLRGYDAVPLRFSIATGQVMAGISGSDAFKPFVLLGTPVTLAVHLLKVAQIHGVSAVVDTATFSTLDSQQFLTRPLEAIAMINSAQGTDMVTVHELICAESHADRDGRLLLWGKAFDALSSGSFDDSLSFLREYRGRYGTSKSALRMSAMALQKRPLSTIADLQDPLLSV